MTAHRLTWAGFPVESVLEYVQQAGGDPYAWILLDRSRMPYGRRVHLVPIFTLKIRQGVSPL